MSGRRRGPVEGLGADATARSAGDMLKGGAHLRDVQAALGHASLQITQCYLPTTVDDLGEATGGPRCRGAVQ